MIRNALFIVLAGSVIALTPTFAADKVVDKSAADKNAAPKVSLDDRLSACAVCHGKDGNGVAIFPDYPKLAGQHEDYLTKALRDYKSGLRKNAIMAGQAQELTLAEMRALARYFSQQAGPLHVVR